MSVECTKKVKKSAKMPHPEPPLIKKTNPHQRVDKPIQQPLNPTNRNTQPPPRVLPSQKSPIFTVAKFPKAEGAVFPRVEEKINNDIEA